ncbi:MAG: Slp family lipoprotein [Nitrospiraceae bacterium]|nr:MAG: Slp family lipoprotein [Nitrospiraceae bacterium]
MGRYNYVIVPLFFLFVISCSYVISKEVRQQAIRNVPFKNILENPSAYENNVFILGGIISETKNSNQGTEIEIVQSPLDRYGYFINRDYSEGRFIVSSSKMLDPLIYKEGRYITVAGRLTGMRTKLLGDLEYSYPLIESIELFLWKEERYYWSEYYYDPYYYRPYYIPYPYYWSYPSHHRLHGPYPWYW